MNKSDELLANFKKITWSNNYNRCNVSGVDKAKFERTGFRTANPLKSYSFGYVNRRCFKDPKISRITEKYPETYRILQELIHEIDPDFEYTTICCNKNVCALPHVDGNNEGESIIVGLGDYNGGEMVIGGETFDVKNKPTRFDGRIEHYTKPFTGDRYTVIWFRLTQRF